MKSQGSMLQPKSRCIGRICKIISRGSEPARVRVFVAFEVEDAGAEGGSCVSGYLADDPDSGESII